MQSVHFYLFDIFPPRIMISSFWFLNDNISVVELKVPRILHKYSYLPISYLIMFSDSTRQSARRWAKRLECPVDENANYKNTFWCNRDLIPIPSERRTWTWPGFAGYWVITGIFSQYHLDRLEIWTLTGSEVSIQQHGRPVPVCWRWACQLVKLWV